MKNPEFPRIIAFFFLEMGEPHLTPPLGKGRGLEKELILFFFLEMGDPT